MQSLRALCGIMIQLKGGAGDRQILLPFKFNEQAH